MDGWIALHRKIQDNPLWTCEPFTRGQAWVDLILIANHKDNFFYKRGVKINVKRGQVGYSELALSKRWQWSRNKVRKFLKDLEKEHQIKQQKTNVTQIVTVLKYEEYQEKGQQTEHQKDTKRTPKGHQKDTNNNENNEDNENNKPLDDIPANKDLPEPPSKKDEAYKQEIKDLLNRTFKLFNDKTQKDVKSKNSYMIKWLDTVDKLNRIDGESFKEIEEVIIWGRKDDFWSTNFLSIAGLRKRDNGISKYEKIKAAMINDIKKQQHGENKQNNRQSNTTPEGLHSIVDQLPDPED